MDLIEKLPGMSDGDLGTLVSNAERLALAGTAKQQQAAQAILPAIQAEMASRSSLKPPKRAPRAGRKTPAGVAVA